MSITEYNQLAEFLGIEPETPGEELFFAKVWEFMSDETKEKVREIEL